MVFVEKIFTIIMIEKKKTSNDLSVPYTRWQNNRKETNIYNLRLYLRKLHWCHNENGSRENSNVKMRTTAILMVDNQII